MAEDKRQLLTRHAYIKLRVYLFLFILLLPSFYEEITGIREYQNISSSCFFLAAAYIAILILLTLLILYLKLKPWPSFWDGYRDRINFILFQLSGLKEEDINFNYSRPDVKRHYRIAYVGIATGIVVMLAAMFSVLYIIYPYSKSNSQSPEFEAHSIVDAEIKDVVQIQCFAGKCIEAGFDPRWVVTLKITAVAQGNQLLKNRTYCFAIHSPVKTFCMPAEKLVGKRLKIKLERIQNDFSRLLIDISIYLDSHDAKNMEYIQHELGEIVLNFIKTKGHSPDTFEEAHAAAGVMLAHRGDYYGRSIIYRKTGDKSFTFVAVGPNGEFDEGQGDDLAFSYDGSYWYLGTVSFDPDDPNYLKQTFPASASKP